MRLIDHMTSVLKPTDLISVVESNISFASCVRPQGRLGNNVVGLMYSTISLNGDPCVASADAESAENDQEIEATEADCEASEAESDGEVDALMAQNHDSYNQVLTPTTPDHPPPDSLLGGH